MIIYILVIAVLALPGLKIQIKGIHSSYISKESANAIKGIFILLIFASHFCNPISKTLTAPLDAAYWKVRVFLGQLVVTMFLFYSGYGIMKSVTEKGKEYIDGFIRRRILPVLLVYDVSQLVFFVIQTSLGKKYGLTDFVLSMIAWKSFGNDNWYIFVILCLYLSTWGAVKLFKGRLRRSAVIVFLTVFLILLLKMAGKGTYWYNTMMCYPLGTMYYTVKPLAEEYLKKGAGYCMVFAGLFVAFLFLHKLWLKNLLFYELTAMVFAMLVVLITMKVSINSPFLRYCGDHLQGLFLIHRAPMILLGTVPFIKENMYVYFVLFVVLAFGAEFIFNKLIVFLRGEH